MSKERCPSTPAESLDHEVQMAVDPLGRTEPLPPPDGGWEAWSCIIAASLLVFTMFGFTNSFGQLQLYYLDHQLSSYAASDVAWISSIQATLMLAGSTLSGRYFDAHGLKLLVRVGTTASIGALVAIAFCHEYYQFLLAHAAFGLAGSLFYSPATAIASHWFTTHRATAVGIVIGGPGLAGVIYPIMIQRLLAQYSFRTVILIIAAMNAGLMAPAWLFMRTRLPPTQPPPWRALRKPWAETPYALLLIGNGIVLINFFTPYFQAPLYTRSNNLPAVYTEYAISITQGSGLIGRCIAGPLADRFGAWRMFICIGVACSVSLFAFWTPTPAPAPVAVVGLVTFGFTSGAYVTLMTACCVSISPVKEAGMRMGMLWSVCSLPILFGPTAAGALISAAGDKFTWAAVYCGSTFLCGTLVAASPRIYGAVARKPEGTTEKEDVTV